MTKVFKYLKTDIINSIHKILFHPNQIKPTMLSNAIMIHTCNNFYNLKMLNFKFNFHQGKKEREAELLLLLVSRFFSKEHRTFRSWYSSERWQHNPEGESLPWWSGQEWWCTYRGVERARLVQTLSVLTTTMMSPKLIFLLGSLCLLAGKYNSFCL